MPYRRTSHPPRLEGDRRGALRAVPSGSGGVPGMIAWVPSVIKYGWEL